MAKQPYKPLTEINIMDEPPPATGTGEANPPALPGTSPAALQPSSQSTPLVLGEDMLPPPEARRQLNYRPTVSTAERLRLISFRQRRPVQELIDEAVLYWLAGQK